MSAERIGRSGDYYALQCKVYTNADRAASKAGRARNKQRYVAEKTLPHICTYRLLYYIVYQNFCQLFERRPDD